jgi:NAD(P)-dependent dehydrogenase (short-subunit alcohol dehydrogenase family)
LDEEQADVKRGRIWCARAVPVPGDIRSEEHWGRLVERAVDEFGRIDVLVNNAAYQMPQPDGILGISTEQFDRMLKTGLLRHVLTVQGIVAFTKALATNLADQGIGVNSVAPGPVWTPLILATMPAEKVPRHRATNSAARRSVRSVRGAGSLPRGFRTAVGRRTTRLRQIRFVGGPGSGR